jgi:hypothetical protein
LSTRFYLPSVAAAAVSPTISAAWEHQNVDRRQMDPGRVNSPFALTTYTPDAADHLVDADAHFVQFISRPLGAQTIAAQTVTIVIRGSEAHTANNCFLTWTVYLVDAAGAFKATLVAIRRDATEFTTSDLARTDSATSTSVTSVLGDYLVLETGLGGTPTGSGGVQGHNGGLQFGDDSGTDHTAADGGTSNFNPWLEFATTTISFAGIDDTVTPAAVAATTTLLAATVGVAATPVPATASLALLDATVSAVISATVTPAAALGTLTLPASVTTAENPNVTVAPSALVGTLSQPSPSVTAVRSATVLPVGADAQVFLSDAIVLIGNHTVEVEALEAALVLAPAVPRILQLAHPSADLAADNWTTQAGAATALFAVVDEPQLDPADFLQSATSPATPNEVKLRLSPLVDPAVSSGHVVRYGYRKDAADGDPIDLTVTLYAADGATAIAQAVHTGVGGTLAVGALTLSAPEADAIPPADYATGLVLGFAAQSSAGGVGDQWDFSAAENSGHVVTAGLA